jgi:hypothetical protein
MMNYTDLIDSASTVVVHDYIELEDDDSGDPEGFNMSKKKWPKGPLQAMLNSPSPPTSAAHAVELYDSALQSHPNHPQAHVWWAQAARLCANDLLTALKYSTKSIQLRKSSDGYYVLAHILLLLGYTKEGHLAAVTAYEIDSWRPKVQHVLRLAMMALVDPSILGHEAVTGGAWCAQCDPIRPTTMSTPPETLLNCSRCGCASYCSKTCQLRAWKHHKPYCEEKSNKYFEAVLATGTTPAHLRVLDGWELPSLEDVALVFGASRDIRNMWFNPPTGAISIQDAAAYERRATIANASAAGYSEVQALQDNRNVTAFRNVVIRLDDDDKTEKEGYDLDTYRAARTAFANVKHCVWDAYCDELLKKQVYIFLTTDYVDALANYLKQRMVEYGGTMVEIGAGNGRLSYFLQQRGVPVIATDDCSWKLDHANTADKDEDEEDEHQEPRTTVEIRNLPCDKALSTYAPSLVLCAWMPMYQDFTAAFRNTPSVREYLLLGPAFTAVCGHAFSTWKAPDGSSDDEVFFARTSLVALEKVQLCKTDRPTEMFAAQTVSFTRIL